MNWKFWKKKEAPAPISDAVKWFVENTTKIIDTGKAEITLVEGCVLITMIDTSGDFDETINVTIRKTNSEFGYYDFACRIKRAKDVAVVDTTYETDSNVIDELTTRCLRIMAGEKRDRILREQEKLGKLIQTAVGE